MSEVHINIGKEVELMEDSWFKRMQVDENNLSNWFPKISEQVRESGLFLLPKTFIHEVPECIYHSLYMEGSGMTLEQHQDKIYKWVRDILYPAIPADLHMPIFMKNGTFSNKFDFSTCTCVCSPLDIAANFMRLSYASLMMETAGNSEIVIRERIMTEKTHELPTIYNGMPMRTEFRVFYDFDSKRVLYCHNYWDYDYCSSHMNPSDKAVFDKFHEKYDLKYEQNMESVKKNIAIAMDKVQGLQGPWSIDVMMDEVGRFWLIDMAMAHTSAYWNKELIED